MMALIAASPLTMPLQAEATDYAVTTLDVPGSSYTQSNGINNTGQVVGWFGTGDGSTSLGFLLQNGNYTTLAGPASTGYSVASGISDAGVVVGSFAPTTGVDADGYMQYGPESGYVYANGAYTVFQIPGYSSTELRGISPNGRYLSGFASSDVNYQGFVYDLVTKSFTMIGPVDENTLVFAQGVNDKGIAVGDKKVYDPSGYPWTRTGFTYDVASGQQTDYAFGVLETALRGINNAGAVVGFQSDMGQDRVAFVISESGHELITIDGAASSYGEGINDAGLIVGDYYDAQGIEHGFLAAAVPEPASWALMVLGAGFVGGVARRRRA
ncbi:PEPxxWA-CTERM sorting domain-containing protein [Pelomonas sp. KK5]|uniref:PEPxxWA-CTERM sorting domain-containing protein n=1 Tax=Pelomonas sp. KK5 TaxID=1855730 RepID=UPI00097BA9F7|nr:PEPxxWA-CTERM sorting domain-containing protein [Pelomonas sp. KK5]